MSKEVQLHEIKDELERVILIGIDTQISSMCMEDSLDELEELAQTAGALTVGKLIQKRESRHPGFYFGKGKIEELSDMLVALDATGIICDDELTPAQSRNLSNMLNVKVMDRTMVILDIFASRAQSSEGKIQVELAQLKYRLSRLAGIGTQLSRLGGGIGTRGPGEKKLESDRRYIKERISELSNSLQEIVIHRKTIRDNREKKGLPVISLIGYTNAGKSTLINALTNANVLAENKLFATLDTTTRNVKLPKGSEMLLTDTVGFIQKLPHQLVQAFRATLEELKYADILLHVVDAANPNRNIQMEVVYQTLKQLGCEATPVITIFNKMDKEVELPLPADKIALSTASISARTMVGLEGLLTEIEEVLQSFRKSAKFLIPYSQGALLSLIHGKCEIITELHTQEGYQLEAYINEEIRGRLLKCGILCQGL